MARATIQHGKKAKAKTKPQHQHPMRKQHSEALNALLTGQNYKGKNVTVQDGKLIHYTTWILTPLPDYRHAYRFNNGWYSATTTRLQNTIRIWAADNNITLLNTD